MAVCCLTRFRCVCVFVDIDECLIHRRVQAPCSSSRLVWCWGFGDLSWACVYPASRQINGEPQLSFVDHIIDLSPLLPLAPHPTTQGHYRPHLLHLVHVVPPSKNFASYISLYASKNLNGGYIPIITLICFSFKNPLTIAMFMCSYWSTGVTGHSILKTLQCGQLET